MTIEKKIFIKQLLSIDGVFKEEPYRSSCFSLALKGARYNLGSNIETGKFDINNIKSSIKEGLYFTKMFTGITLYLILLEQIGTLIKKGKNNNANCIKVALKRFSTPLLSNQEINGLTCLRHSLAHNFGLVNDKKGISTKFKYGLGFNIDDKLIEINSNWYGTYSNEPDDCSTKIGIYAFATLVEGIIISYIDAVDNNTVKLYLGLNEIKARFTIKIATLEI